MNIETGEVVQHENIDKEYFAEGLTDWNNHLIQITWQSKTGFTYDLKTQKRATIVGETTGGGAHPVRGRRIATGEYFSAVLRQERPSARENILVHGIGQHWRIVWH